MDLMGLSKDERFLLEWLSKEGYSQYGECCGESLNGLIAKGLATVHSFAAQGSARPYCLVALTDAGRASIQKTK